MTNKNLQTLKNNYINNMIMKFNKVLKIIVQLLFKKILEDIKLDKNLKLLYKALTISIRNYMDYFKVNFFIQRLEN